MLLSITYLILKACYSFKVYYQQSPLYNPKLVGNVLNNEPSELTLSITLLNVYQNCSEL